MIRATQTYPGGEPPEASDKEAIQSEIERTRDDLGETVVALSEKTDVKAQASAKAHEVKQRARDVSGQAKLRADDVADQVKKRPAPVAVGVAMVMVLWLMRKRRRRRRDRGALDASPPER